jgi:hypothetical protein
VKPRTPFWGRLRRDCARFHGTGLDAPVMWNQL